MLQRSTQNVESFDFVDRTLLKLELTAGGCMAMSSSWQGFRV